MNLEEEQNEAAADPILSQKTQNHVQFKEQNEVYLLEKINEEKIEILEPQS